MKRVLIIACSRRKRTKRGLLPAIERYDGPAFRLLRRFLRQSKSAPTILILSAKYGLIELDQPITNYDERMTSQRASRLQEQIAVTLRAALNGAGGGPAKAELFLCAGKEYFEALGNSIPPGVTVKFARGSMGKKLAALHQWLYASPPAANGSPKNSAGPRQAVRIRGHHLKVNKNEALKIARAALERADVSRNGHHIWYVLVGGRRVSPKWLVGLLTGLPVSAFHTDEARRVLRQIGVPVLRNGV